jgi:hypothetical protein
MSSKQAFSGISVVDAPAPTVCVANVHCGETTDGPPSFLLEIPFGMPIYPLLRVNGSAWAIHVNR